MDLDELRSVQSKERTKDSLQHLRDSFYEDVAAYLAERKRQRDERAAGVDNPFSDQQVRKLSDEIETAEEVVESLYERRVGKVVKLSSFAAAGAPTDTEGMTVQEVELFEDLVVRIEQNKNRVLNVLETGADVAIDADSGAAGAVSTEPSAGSDAPPAAVAEASTPDSAGAKEPTDGPEDDASGVLADAMGGDGAPSNGSSGGATTETRPSDGADGDANADTHADPTATIDANTDSKAGTDAKSAADAPPGNDSPPGEFVPGSEPDRAGGAVVEPAGSDESAATAAADSTAESTGTAAAPESAATAEQAAGSDSTEPADGTDRRTVRITRDVGQILGVDEREYELASDDVVTLPTANADPLLQRDAAEPIE
ncbi:hypothetical protein [Halobaculum halobium]|uniref:DNA replication factor GINS n=1 Tax=Halobaculum halobium TaxID=3032281 RepID=A0ABD5TD12_9EURY|nr:hypothetical protein [Halobaculum sp. SYNS20]